eukprot:358969-Ditylum_brightwellii.AAC.1
MMTAMMMMVTGVKPPVPVPTSTLFSNVLVTPTKSSVQSMKSPEGTAITTVSGTSVEDKDDDKIEQKITEEIVLHDTALYMNTPPSPGSAIPDPNIQQIRDIKEYLKKNNTT